MSTTFNTHVTITNNNFSIGLTYGGAGATSAGTPAATPSETVSYTTHITIDNNLPFDLTDGQPEITSGTLVGKLQEIIPKGTKSATMTIMANDGTRDSDQSPLEAHPRSDC